MKAAAVYSVLGACSCSVVHAYVPFHRGPSPPPSARTTSPAQHQLPGRLTQRGHHRVFGALPRNLQYILLSLLPILGGRNAGAYAAEDAQQQVGGRRGDFATVTRLQNRAFELTNRFDFAEADKVWTEILELDTSNAAAWSNRANCRTSVGRCEEALSDFNRAVTLAPEEPDPYLGRGVAKECVKDFAGAIEDYEVANQLNIKKTGSEDPVTYNNKANAEAGLGRWADALRDYSKAGEQRDYVFPRQSAALVLYQIGEDAAATREFKKLLLRYPNFADVRAALVAIYWKQGELSRAEGEWSKLLNEDPRYRNIEWVRDVRRWPPRMVDALQDFLSLKLRTPSKVVI